MSWWNIGSRAMGFWLHTGVIPLLRQGMCSPWHRQTPNQAPRWNFSILCLLAAAAARVSRRLQERTGHHYSPRHTAPASVPLSDQFLAISGTAPAARSGMPPAKRQRAAAAAGSLRGGYETISGLAVPAAHGVHATAQPSAAPTPRQTAAARKGGSRGSSDRKKGRHFRQ